MNKRIKELAVQAGMEVDLVTGGFDVWFSDGYYIDVIERFAELVRQDERGACARACETQADDGGELDIQEQCANAIRARGKNEQD